MTGVLVIVVQSQIKHRLFRGACALPWRLSLPQLSVGTLTQGRAFPQRDSTIDGCCASGHFFGYVKERRLDDAQGVRGEWNQEERKVKGGWVSRCGSKK